METSVQTQEESTLLRKDEEKRRIDEEEKKYQEIEKQIIVDRANKFFFESQDAVKSFNSKLLVADAYKEREFQKEIQQRKKEIDKDIEDEFLKMRNQQLVDFAF